MNSADENTGIRIIESIQKCSLSRESRILDLGENEVMLINKILKSTNNIANFFNIPITDYPVSFYASDRLELLKWRILLSRVEKTLYGFRHLIRIKNSWKRIWSR